MMDRHQALAILSLEFDEFEEWEAGGSSGMTWDLADRLPELAESVACGRELSEDDQASLRLLLRDPRTFLVFQEVLDDIRLFQSESSDAALRRQSSELLVELHPARMVGGRRERRFSPKSFSAAAALLLIGGAIYSASGPSVHSKISGHDEISGAVEVPLRTQPSALPEVPSEGMVPASVSGNFSAYSQWSSQDAVKEGERLTCEPE